MTRQQRDRGECDYSLHKHTSGEGGTGLRSGGVSFQALVQTKVDGVLLVGDGARALLKYP